MTNTSALRSIGSAVSATANSIGAIFNTTTRGISMLDKAIVKASNDQQDRHTIHRDTYRERLIREATMEETNADLEIIEFCSQSETHREQYSKNYDRFSGLFNPKEGA